MTTYTTNELFQSISPGVIGDVGNSILLFSYIVYIIIVILHASGLLNLTLFGLNWASDGFCLSYKGTFYTSHLLCFYLDTAFTILLYLASRSITADSNPNLLVVKAKICLTGDTIRHIRHCIQMF